MDKKRIKENLNFNVEWFRNSGIMDPTDGSWGVGERVVLTESNEALEKIFRSFSTYSAYDNYAILEHRRPDCNFETSLLFLLASEIFESKEYYRTGRNILRYLFFRSGSLFSRSCNKNTRYETWPTHAWRWASEMWEPVVFFDDNAWNCTLSLMIGRIWPELDEQFELKRSALLLASEMEEAFSRQFPQDECPEDVYKWAGDLKSPHWGSLVCMALAFAYRENLLGKYRAAIRDYHNFLGDEWNSFTTSEHAYIVLGGAVSGAFLKDEDVLEVAMRSAEKLIEKQGDHTGNIPSEWSKEAPVGENLVDMIYTQNWAVLGLQIMKNLTEKTELKKAFEKALHLLLKIQDNSPEKYLHGCWRGMYDLENDCWGGGDRYEGGANSIYSGWTNAPISIALALELANNSLVS